MRLPRWIVVAPKSEWRSSPDGKSAVIPVRLRWWHPGLWLALLRERKG